jgi:rhodanese-related sulfurtransferase
MSKIPLAAFAVVVLCSACNSKPTTSQREDAKSATQAAGAAKATPELSVAEVATALREKRATVIDANGLETRQKYGVVPGAVLLSDHRNYALTELPSDKQQPLVFYCGGTQCRASDAAASRAQSAGYASVSVMREGIRGWVSAGQPVAGITKS